MSQLPKSVDAVVIGAGIHGLEEMAGMKPGFSDAARFATGDRSW